MQDNLRIVLVGTSHPGNIGAAARAMKTMGLRRLVLVAPEAFPHREAIAMAAGAEDVLDAAQVVPDVETALADCGLVLGCTARRRSVALPELSPRAAAAEFLAAAAKAPAALLFGRERTGLTNDELQRCQMAVHIPADPTYSSLNLAAAVQVLSYEVRVASLEATAPNQDAAGIADEPPANQGEMEGFFGHLDTTLGDIDFHKGRAPEIVMQRLRRLFLRAAPDSREVRILRGILTDAQRMARLAREAGKA
jgi:tRNA (cytidine32/uridine32-2'-O)-methyltransferase